MSYLHSHNILHRDLKPENILMDDYLHPKISDFGLSKITDFISESMNFKSGNKLIGTPVYMAPEILSDGKYSKSSNVYAFAYIVFEIVTCDVPFKDFNIFKLMNKVMNNGYRPEIKDDVPNAYKELIERCWSQNADDRPSFDEIVEDLKTNEEFITDLVDQSEFLDYVDFVDNYRSTFDVSKRILHFSDFIEANGRNKIIKPISLNESYSIKSLDDEIYNKSKVITEIKIQSKSTQIIEGQKVLEIEENEIKQSKNIESDKVLEIEENETKQSKSIESDQSKKFNLIYPKLEFDKLSKTNQKLVENAENEKEKQFEVDVLLIEAKNGFPSNINLGLQYLEKSIDQKYNNAIVYYIKLLIKGKYLERNLKKAKEYLSKLNGTDDKRIFLLQGLISYKNNKFSEAVDYFSKGSKLGDIESMYKYGKMLFIGEGTKKNDNEAFRQLINSKEKGFKKSEYFITAFNSLNKNKDFLLLPPETQLIFITNNIKNLQSISENNEKKIESEFDQIILHPKKTEKIFFNKSLKSSKCQNCLDKYKKVSIEVEFPSASFKSIIDLVIKIQYKIIYKIKIGILLSSLTKKPSKKCFSFDISYHIINTSIDDYAFEYLQLSQVLISSSVVEIGKYAFAGCSSLKEVTFIDPSFLIKIREGAFYECTSLTRIFIPNSVTEIEDSSFYGCSSLEQISIPSSVTKISKNVFNGIKSLEIIGDINTIYKFMFYECSSLTQIKIPSSVTEIESSTFSRCTSLTQITIPSSVTKIDLFVFEGIESLQINGDIKYIFSSMFNGCRLLKNISIPSSVTEIKDHAFAGCKSLTQFSIPSSVTKICKRAFEECSSLEKIEIPPSITKIGSYAFAQCYSLIQFFIPSSITEIKVCTFELCKSLTQITIPSSVTIIKNYVFNGCCSLNQVYFETPSSITDIGCKAFYKCSSLTQILLPSSLKSIKSFAFYGCKSLTQIIDQSYKIEYGNDVFGDCPSIREESLSISLKLYIKRNR